MLQQRHCLPLLLWHRSLIAWLPEFLLSYCNIEQLYSMPLSALVIGDMWMRGSEACRSPSLPPSKHVKNLIKHVRDACSGQTVHCTVSRSLLKKGEGTTVSNQTDLMRLDWLSSWIIRLIFFCFVFLFFAATQVSASELQDVFNETSSNIFQINANGKSPVREKLCPPGILSVWFKIRICACVGWST